MSNQQWADGGWPLGTLLAGLAHVVYHHLIDPMRRHACSRAGERELRGWTTACCATSG